MTQPGVRIAIRLCAAVLALLATGCHVEQPHPPTPSSDATQALQQLKSLPSLEETKTQVEQAIAEITAAASKLVPSLVWQSVHGEGQGNCEAPYEQSDGKRVFLPDMLAAAPLSESDWATILAAARQSAATIGATNEQVVRDEPGHHDVWFSGPTGIFIKIAYRGNLVVSGYTGCRLPQDKK